MTGQIQPFPEETIGPFIRRRLAGFARTLRDNGYRVGTAETRDAHIILASPAMQQMAVLKAAFRALFCAMHSDWEKFDEVFTAFWTGRNVRRRASAGSLAAESQAPQRRLAGSVTEEAARPPGNLERREQEGPDEISNGQGMRERASRAELLAATDMRHITDPEDIAKTNALIERLAAAMRARLLRRTRTRRSGSRLNLRRTIHLSVARGGTPLDLAFKRRKIKPLKLVVLLDASGSMSLYTTFFIRFLHGVIRIFHQAEAFVFHTRLVHVSPSLRDRDIARAIDRLSLMAQGIGGGTRIGESLASFNRWHAARVIHSRTAVIIVSDGYDTGEPEALAQEMRRLRRRCRRIAWLNPLIGWRGYAPEAGGMKAALPYIDLFAPAHNLKSLAALEPYLSKM